MALYTFAHYRFDFPMTDASHALVVIGLSIVGAVILWLGPWRGRMKLLIIGAYVPLMVVALTFAGLSTGCAMGDCL